MGSGDGRVLLSFSSWWCVVSSDDLGELFSVSRPTVFRTINRIVTE